MYSMTGTINSWRGRRKTRVSSKLLCVPGAAMDPLLVWQISKLLLLQLRRRKVEVARDPHPALFTDVILSQIFGYLDREDLKNCRLVCRSWCFIASAHFSKKSKVCLFSSVAGDAREEEESESDPYSRRCQSLNGFIEFLKRRDGLLGIRFRNYDLCLQEHSGGVRFLAMPEVSTYITSLSLSVMGPCLLWLRPILPKLQSLKVLDIHGGMENELIRKEFRGTAVDDEFTDEEVLDCNISYLIIQSYARGIASECLKWILPMSPRLTTIELEEAHWDGCKCMEIIKSSYRGPGLVSLKLGGMIETTDSETGNINQGQYLKRVLETCTTGSLKELLLESWICLPSSVWKNVFSCNAVRNVEKLSFNAVVRARTRANNIQAESVSILELMPTDMDADPRDFLSCFPSSNSRFCASKLKNLKMRLYYRILDSFPGAPSVLEVRVGTSRIFPQVETFYLLIEGVDLQKRHILVNPTQHLRCVFPSVKYVNLSGTFIGRVNEVLRSLPPTVETLCLGSEYGSSMQFYDVEDSDLMADKAIFMLPVLRILKLQRRLRCHKLTNEVAINGFLRLPNLQGLSLCGHNFSDAVVAALREKLRDVDLSSSSKLCANRES